MPDPMQGWRWVRRVVPALALALAVLAGAVAPAQEAEAAPETASPLVWSPGGQCFRSREPTPEEVADYGVPPGTTGAHSFVLWAGPENSGYYFPGCVPPGYEYNGVWWDKADSPYQMVDCTEALEPSCFWHANGTGKFTWSKKAFVGFVDPAAGPGGAGGGGSPRPGPDGSVDCGAGIVLRGADIDNALATLRATGNFTDAGLGDMRTDPCRYFPTSCLNLGAYMDHLTDDARRSFQRQLSGPNGYYGLADRILDEPCGFVDEQWLVAGLPNLALIPTLPAPPVAAPTQLIPPMLPFTIPGGGDPAVDRCRYMTEAIPEGAVPAAAVAAAPKGVEETLVASAAGAEPNPAARWYERIGRFVLDGTQSGVQVNLNGVATPTMGAGEFFESVEFNSHLTVQVFPGYDPETCQEVERPPVEWIQIREVYHVVGTDRSRFRDTTLHSGCTGTSLCRRNWDTFEFTESAAIGGGVTGGRHYVFVTVKLQGRPPQELESVSTDPLAFY